MKWLDPCLNLLLAMVLLLSLSGCTGDELLANSVTAVNREIATLQDQLVLMNIIRRSLGQPAHFPALSLIHGHSRLSGTTSFRFPFGPGSASQFRFEPSFSLDTGPNYELSPQNNKEFLRGYLTPVSLAVLAAHLRRQHNAVVVLALTVAEIVCVTRMERSMLLIMTLRIRRHPRISIAH